MRRMIKLAFLCFLILSACDISNKDLEGKYINESGEHCFIKTAGKNKIILTVDGHFGATIVVLTQDKKRSSKYTYVIEQGYHTSFYYELIAQDSDNLKFTRITTSLETGLKNGTDIKETLTRINE